MTDIYYHAALFKQLSIADRLLTPAILLAMIIGVVIGEYAHHVQKAFNTARFDTVSIRESFLALTHLHLHTASQPSP